MSAAVEGGRSRPSQRISSFDGARGVMSLVVVLWHAFLILSPAMVAWVLTHRRSPEAWWWFAADPPELLTTAIVVFFILSGVVLTLPAIRSGFSWSGYYSSRLLRLYLPAWAALLLGSALILLFHRGYAPSNTWLGSTNATHFRLRDLLWEATLLTQTPRIDNPLWSISWEVAFSICLPLFVLIAMKTQRHWLVAIVASILVTAVGEQLKIVALMYLPTFLIGSIIAANLGRVMAVIEVINVSRWHTAWWWLILAASVTSAWGSRVSDSLSLVKPFTLINHVLASTTVIGFLGFIFIAMGNHTASRFLGSRLSQQLGRLSYSLYLVHVPILATLAFALTTHLWLAPLIGIPLSIVAAVIFARYVEQPAHRFGKAVGRLVASRREARALTRPQVPQRADENASSE